MNGWAGEWKGKGGRGGGGGEGSFQRKFPWFARERERLPVRFVVCRASQAKKGGKLEESTFPLCLAVPIPIMGLAVAQEGREGSGSRIGLATHSPLTPSKQEEVEGGGGGEAEKRVGR